MKTGTRFAALLASASAAVVAGPAWQGLDVKIENLPPGTRVNGVAIAATRISGPDVTALAERLERQWASEPDSVVTHWKVTGPWRILSRTKGSLSQVLQLPDEFGAQYALLSQLDLRQRTVPPREPAVRLPQVCTVANTVQAESSREEELQLVASCRAPASTVAAQLRQSARSAGLREQGRNAPGFSQWQAEGVEVLAVVTDDPGGRAAGRSVVVLQQQRSRQ
ncbi:MAG: hypothetical protein ABI859_07540 [Pseudomonadota bacterium]